MIHDFTSVMRQRDVRSFENKYALPWYVPGAGSSVSAKIYYRFFKAHVLSWQSFTARVELCSTQRHVIWSLRNVAIFFTIKINETLQWTIKLCISRQSNWQIEEMTMQWGNIHASCRLQKSCHDTISSRHFINFI